MKNSTTQKQVQAFERMIAGQGMTPWMLLSLAFQALLDPFRFIIIYMPGKFGFALRRLYYRRKLCKMGKSVFIDVAVRISGPENISIDDETIIGMRTTLEGALGTIQIGKSVKIGSSVVIGSGESLAIGDKVVIKEGCKIYSQSEVPVDGKRTSGPMIPWEHKGYRKAPVVIEENALLGFNCVVLPGVTIAKDSRIKANSVVTRNVRA